jgi:polyphenol oxidase
MLQCTPLVPTVRHGFTTRQLTLRDDEREWASLASWAGVADEDMLLIRQVHGAGVAVASPGRPSQWERPEADAIISNDPRAALVVRVADCVPILLTDETGRAVAAIHAGWRGTMKRVAIAAVSALQARYGLRPERLIAAVGPSIGPCCYEVGETTLQTFREAGHHPTMIERWFQPRSEGRYHLDLWMATRDELEGAGLNPGSIHVAELCTKTHNDVFHSYRVDGDRAGRLAALIRPRA